MSNWIDILLYGDRGMAAFGWETIVLGMMLSLVLGHIVGWVYMASHSGLSYSRTFVASLVVVPVIVTMLMVLMTTSIVIAFGLLAVFAVVRFRNVLKDTRDTMFILWSIVMGMSVGTQRYSTAVIGCLFIGIIFIYLRLTSFGTRHRYDVVLSLIWTGPAPGPDALRDILHRHAVRIQLASQQPSEGGTDLSYRLLLRDTSRSQDLLSELRAMDDVSDASLYQREDESEI
ncbi:MAG: DUF4956 domain-containing protein [Phycisphaerae bacterium]|jgi:hypothetical protein|nr:DUF4956 domain-containing protein [Phycisphaerae bacterium]